MKINCKEIIIVWLKQNHMDGLCNLESGCGCDIENFAPCDCLNIDDCRPAHKGKCTCGEGCDFDMFINEKDLP